jgi:hypothetical protein
VADRIGLFLGEDRRNYDVFLEVDLDRIGDLSALLGPDGRAVVGRGAVEVARVSDETPTADDALATMPNGPGHRWEFRPGPRYRACYDRVLDRAGDPNRAGVVARGTMADGMLALVFVEPAASRR